jgi:hypothetical protein
MTLESSAKGLLLLPPPVSRSWNVMHFFATILFQTLRPRHDEVADSETLLPPSNALHACST